jgi:hypothetical protein
MVLPEVGRVREVKHQEVPEQLHEKNTVHTAYASILFL